MEERLEARQQPPYSAEAERSVLGSMLLDKNALEIALEQLREEDFFVPAHAQMFAAARDLRSRGEAVDLVTLADELERYGKLESAGGAAYLADTYAYVPTAANIQEYAGIVEEKSVRRQLMRAGGEIIAEGSREEMPIDKVLDAAERRVYDISMRKTSDSVVPIGDIVPNAYAKIGEMMSRRGQLTGVNTGFYDLNRMTNGLQKSDLIIVAARPAMGKTAFALNMAQYAAIHDHRKVLIFELEMSAEQLVMRMLCSEAGVESQKIKEGTIDPDDTDRLLQVLDPISKSGVFIDDTGGVTVAEVRSKCRRLKARYGLDMVIIDYLQLMTAGGGRKGDSRTQEVSDMTRQLKLLARELDVPIVLLAQLNREADKRSDHRPLLSDLRESGSIEQDADMVILLFRPAVYAELAEEGNKAYAIAAKNRHGPIGDVELVWQGEYTRFMNKAREDME